MKKSVCSLLAGYGCLVAALGLLAQQLSPELARPALLTGVIGGGLSILWAVLGLLKRPHRGWAIFTLAGGGFVLLSQVVTHWMPSGQPVEGTRNLALVTTAMFVATFSMIMTVAHTDAPDANPGNRA